MLLKRNSALLCGTLDIKEMASVPSGPRMPLDEQLSCIAEVEAGEPRQC
jgi:hypothetical protein